MRPDFYSAWPAFVCLALLVALAATRLLAGLDAPQGHRTRRLSQIDGLRGFLALAVFFHHAPIYHSFEMTGGWWLPRIRFFQTLGPLGVSLFFMITGFLFYGKLLDEGARPDWMRLYVGRLARIGPLYLVGLAIMLATIAAASPHLHVPPAGLAREIGTWLLLGYGRQVDINRYRDTWTLDAGVTWTLHYEWLFYAALVPLALVARLAGRWTPGLTFAGLAACLGWAAVTPPSELPPTLPVLLSMFLVGMSCAVAERRKGPFVERWKRPVAERRKGPFAVQGPIGSLLVLVLLGATFAWPGVYSFATTVLLGAAFALVVRGNTLSGLLTSRAAIRLGDISFGIYLLQAPALGTVFALAPVALKRSAPGFWVCVFAAAVLLVVMAALAHRLVERPGIAAGRRVADRLGRRRVPAAGARRAGLRGGKRAGGRD